MHLELKSVVEAVGKEKNIDHALIIEALREAILIAAKKHYGECIFETRHNEETQDIELIRYRTVVEDSALKNPYREITLSEAQVMDDSLQLGDEVGEALPTSELGRIAAQFAKQTIVQKVTEAERERMMKDYREKKGQIVIGQVRAFDKQDLIIDLGQADAILPIREQIPGEKYKLRDKITAILLEVKRSTRGPQIILSRANPEFLVRLFEQEVTEVSDGLVVIQAAARDPGSRSKIAVYSTDTSVDPVGACVGLKGVRVQAVVQELRGEKIDIIPYDRDAARFVCSALAPAEPSKVIVNERLHTMEVVVPDEHLSLAIGRRGQNVRLAAQLTGWKVDIRSEARMREVAQESRNLIAKIPDLGDIRAEILVNEGYKDPTDIARMDVRALIRILRLTPEEAETVIRGAAELAERIESEKKKSLDDDWADLGLEASFDSWGGVVESAHDAEAVLEDLVAKKAQPLVDPEKISAHSISQERQKYWMALRGVGEQTAAVLETVDFQNYANLGSFEISEIAQRTGLPLRLCGKIHAEATKNAGL